MKPRMPDYPYLRRLSQQSGEPLETLVERWNEGLRGRQLTPRRPVTEGWLTSAQAAELLCVSVETLYSTGCSVRQVVRSRSRSGAGRGARGAGRIYHREDCAYLRRVRQEGGFSDLQQAVRAVIAHRNGVL